MDVTLSQNQKHVYYQVSFTLKTNFGVVAA